MKPHVIIIISILILLLLLSYMKRNKIIAAVTEQLTPNFTLGELMVTNQPFPNIPNEQERMNLRMLAVNVLQPVRNLLGKPIAINSAFRSQDVNRAVGGVDNSQHRKGFAADFHVPGMKLIDVYKAIAKSKIPFDQLIIEYGKHPESEKDDWIHISYNPLGGRRQLLTASWSNEAKKMIYQNMTV